MTFQQVHLISTIHKLFRNDERLIYFFFSHKRPELRLGPGELLQEARCLSSGEYILIQAAMDFWVRSSRFRLVDALGCLDDDNVIALVKAILHWREIDIACLLDEESC
jgi:hypothetical protein